MADEKKSGLIDKIGLFLDKTFTFGGALNYDQDIIDNAESQLGVDSWKKIDNQADFDNFKEIVKGMQKKKNEGTLPDKGKDGGAVMKMKRGGMVKKPASRIMKPASRSNKPRVAGRLASRGYGKAFKGK